MKKKPLLILLLILVLCLTMFMTACGGSSDDSKADPGEAAETSEAAVEEETSESEEPAAPGTLEEYFNENEDTLAGMMGDDESGVKIYCKGNDFIYLYDFSKMEDSNLTEEDMKNEVVVDSLKESLEDGGYTFGNVAQSLEKLTGISGINVVVTYTWGDEVIFSKSFTSADME